MKIGSKDFKERKMLKKNGIALKRKIKIENVGNSEYYFNLNNKITIHNTLKAAYNNLKIVFNNNNRIAYIESSKRLVKCNNEGLKHGISQNNSNITFRANAFIISNVGFLLKNAAKINETSPSLEYPKGQDIYLSAIRDDEGNIYPSRIIVNKDTSYINEVETIDKLKAIKGIKKTSNNVSKYTIEELAEEIADHYSDCYPKLLIKQLSIKRKESTLSKNIIF